AYLRHDAGRLTHEELRPYQRVGFRALGVGHDRPARDRAAARFHDRLGRGLLNYAPGIEHNSVVSKEQIMALPNLHFYWKYGDAVVPFRIEPVKRPKRAPAFLLRQPRQVAEPRQSLPAHAPAKQNDHEQVDELEMAPQDADPL